MHITSPFINQLSDSFKNLTPKEIQVAAMIRDGRSSKEIAEFLGVSVGTVVTHRNSIRKKLKLSSRDINLRSRLLSLA
jgi:DNA-binding CsgD family transcriptional regulator